MTSHRDDLSRLGPPPVEPLSDLAWSRIERGLWQRLDAGEPAALAPSPSAVATSSFRRRFLWIAAPTVAVAAAIVLVVVTRGGGTVPNGAGSDGPLRLVSGNSPSSATIGDAHITLDPTSAVVMNISDPSATAVVERGGAWFAVTPRGERPPFVVVAGDTVVRVIGTRFRVARDAEVTRVEVEHGLVDARFHGIEVAIGAGHAWSSARPAEVLPIQLASASGTSGTGSVTTASGANASGASGSSASSTSGVSDTSSASGASGVSGSSGTSSASGASGGMPGEAGGTSGTSGTSDATRSTGASGTGNVTTTTSGARTGNSTTTTSGARTTSGTGNVTTASGPRTPASGTGNVTTAAGTAATTMAGTAGKPEDDQTKYERLAGLERRDPTAAIAGYLELSARGGRWAEVGLYAAARLAADRADPRAKTLLTIYLRRFPSGANAGDARELLTRIQKGDH